MDAKIVVKELLAAARDLTSFLKVNNEPRPPRMKRPKVTSGRRHYHLYIQDELKDVLVDKYGKERGEKTWEYLISQPNKGMYTVGQDVTDEKAQMYLDLKEPIPSDYWHESYYDVWKRWMARSVAAAVTASGEPMDQAILRLTIKPKSSTDLRTMLRRTGAWDGERPFVSMLANLVARNLIEKVEMPGQGVVYVRHDKMSSMAFPKAASKIEK